MVRAWRATVIAGGCSIAFAGWNGAGGLAYGQDAPVPVPNQQVPVPVPNQQIPVPVPNQRVPVPVPNQQVPVPVPNQQVPVPVPNQRGPVPVPNQPTTGGLLPSFELPSSGPVPVPNQTPDGPVPIPQRRSGPQPIPGSAVVIDDATPAVAATAAPVAGPGFVMVPTVIGFYEVGHICDPRKGHVQYNSFYNPVVDLATQRFRRIVSNGRHQGYYAGYRTIYTPSYGVGGVPAYYAQNSYGGDPNVLGYGSQPVDTAGNYGPPVHQYRYSAGGYGYPTTGMLPATSIGTRGYYGY